MGFRTDLALENCEFLGKKTLEGIEINSFEAHDAKITRIEVTDDEGSKAIGKPKGKYVTVEVKPFAEHAQMIDNSFSAVCTELTELLPETGSVLVAGLGNVKITPDALGPKCASMIFATRHITGEILRSTGLGELRSVSVITPGVLGDTGSEASEIIKAVSDSVKPSLIITVDALAARNVSRLGTTIQMCTSGITPGSGVGNSRKEISAETVGVPVLAIGVPTVVDAATMIGDLAGGTADEEASEMMVTPREVDMMIERASKLIALAINCALQPSISPEDMLMLTS